MNYTQAVDYIHSLLKFGVRPGLTGMNALLHLLGNPHKNMKYIHVAGTNGKGSTSTAISNILVASGYNVGLYTSPYVCNFLERVQFNAKPVDEAVFAENVKKVKSAVEELQKREVIITEFEALTAAAFLCFRDLKCDAVVLEVGLGGRLDATNVIDCPLCNVVTSLSLDHTGILGDTIEKIAYEKCGTLKGNCSVVSSYGQPQSALNVIKETVLSKNGALVIPDESDITILKTDLFGTEFIYKNEKYKITMPGIHQVKNMTVAIECCNILNKTFNISPENIKKGIESTVLPARVEVLSRQPLIVLDGGHNEDGAKAFFDSVQNNVSSYNRVIVVAGMMKDKAVEVSLEPLLSNTDVFFGVTPQNPRSMTASELCDIAKKYCKNVTCSPSTVSAIDEATSLLHDGAALFIVGSLYLAGEIREYLIKKIRQSN